MNSYIDINMCSVACPCNSAYQGGWMNFTESQLNNFGRTGTVGPTNTDTKGMVRMNWKASTTGTYNTFVDCSAAL